jgi:hypothetical protein
MSRETHNCEDSVIENMVNTLIGRCDAMVMLEERGVMSM